MEVFGSLWARENGHRRIVVGYAGKGGSYDHKSTKNISRGSGLRRRAAGPSAVLEYLCIGIVVVAAALAHMQLHQQQQQQPVA